MLPNPQEKVDLVTFTEEIINGEFHFCAVLELTISPLYLNGIDHRCNTRNSNKINLIF